jgi:hypothetical protein
MRKVVLSLFFVFVFHQAQAGLGLQGPSWTRLFRNEKRSIFDIIPDSASERPNRKCFRKPVGNCITRPAMVTVFNSFENKLKQNIKNIPSKQALKMDIKKYFKTKNRKRPDSHTLETLRKEIKNYIRRTKIKEELLKRIIKK